MIRRLLDKIRVRGGAAGSALVALSFVVLMGLPALAAEKLIKPEVKKEKTPVFEVPTTGRIMDVQYRPEFDEWWVTCREGENITVYSYDKRSQRWGQATFTPRGADQKTSKSGLKDRDRSASIEETEGASPAGRIHEPTKAEEPRPDTRKEADKVAKPDAKKWWDPLNIIKQGGEKLLQPFQ